MSETCPRCHKPAAPGEVCLGCGLKMIGQPDDGLIERLGAELARLRDFIQWQFEDDDVDAAWADYEARDVTGHDSVQQPVTAGPVDAGPTDGAP